MDLTAIPQPAIPPLRPTETAATLPLTAMALPLLTTVTDHPALLLQLMAPLALAQAQAQAQVQALDLLAPVPLKEVLASRLLMRMVPRRPTTTMEARPPLTLMALPQQLLPLEATPIPMTMARIPPLTVTEVLLLTTLMAHRPILQQPTAPRPPTMTVQ